MLQPSFALPPLSAIYSVFLSLWWDLQPSPALSMGVAARILLVPETMHKAKSPSQAHKILPKKWRKLKTGPSAKASSTPLWKSEGSCTWSSMSGRKVTLTSVNLLQLSEIERLVLQKLALAKLQALQLGCSIQIPKDGSSQKRFKRAAFSLKRKTPAEPGSSGWVFGIPLAKCISNDTELRRRRPSLTRERRESLDLQQSPRRGRKSSSSSVSLFPLFQLLRSQSVAGVQANQSDQSSENVEVMRSVSCYAGAASSDSLSESDSKSTGSSLLDALSLSSSMKLENAWRDRRDSLSPRSAQVPYVVRTCCKHLETYGLRVLGIFRIGSSKKRTKQLREEFDSGKDVILDDEHNAHDVAALLKEFFRDLSDPLLTRDLYSAFVALRKIKDSEKRLEALQWLLCLLPVVNRDTLSTLLTFLQTVVQHSTDRIDDSGQTLPGNRMDSHNLATLFGPNILHKAKGREFEVETLERAEERKEVIAVIQEMIDQHKSIFELSAEMHNEILRVLCESNAEAVDYLLKHKSAALSVDCDAETSSSFCEESDSSSIPRSPSYSSETDSAHPRNLTEALALQSQEQPTPRASKVCSTEPPVETLKVPQFRIITPEQGWYRPDSRSPSPVSPRISPSPKAMKAATPDLRISITRDLPDRNLFKGSHTTQALLSPRPLRFRKQLIPSSARPNNGQGPDTLSVPGLRRDRETESSSSLSSCYPSSSRSATNSPITPDMPQSPRWYPETPPTSPPGGSVHVTLEPDHRTSSQTRPLGIKVKNKNNPQQECKPGASLPPEWQKERWKHWEKLAKEHSDEFHEQETLV